MEINFGDIFYSEHFKGDCVVVNYKDEDNWYFVLKRRPHHILKAQAKPEDLKWLRRG